jgi:hypothetical protein
MNPEEARQILILFRPGVDDPSDPFFAEALRQAETDSDLAKWWAEEHEFDRVFAAQIKAMPVPGAIRTVIKARVRAQTNPTINWLRAAGLAAAALALAILIVNVWPRQAVPLDDYRGEMIGFVKLTPSLELETHKLEQIKDWLEQSHAPSVVIPAGLAGFKPLGCRVLTFRGRKVTLVCFDRGGGKLIHLLAVDSAILPKLPSRDGPIFEPEGEWMTAAWQENNQAYLLTTQGDKALLERYLKKS